LSQLEILEDWRKYQQQELGHYSKSLPREIHILCGGQFRIIVW